MEDHRQRLAELLFAHLDGELPDQLKRKLTSSDAKTIVMSLVNWLQDNRDLNVLLGTAREDRKGSRTSRFAPDESPEFLNDLSKL